MPPLSDIPFYGAFRERSDQNEKRPLAELQKVSGAMSLATAMQHYQQEQEVREALAASGGDLEKAVPALIKSGNIAGAGKLAQLLEVQRKQNAPRVVSPGSQVLGPKNEVLHSVPFAPPRPQAQPEIVNLQAMMEKLPEGHPFRSQLQSRITHLSRGEQQAPRPFGSGATGGALDIMTRLARGYGAGATNDSEDREFETAVTHYTQSRMVQNPDTGIMERHEPRLPQFVQEAINTRRGARPAPPQPAPAPAAAPKPAAQPTVQSDQTVWGLASLVSGPVPAAAETLSRTPVVGSVVRAPQFTQARNFVPLLQRDLVRVLQNNPRYAEGERRAIEQEVNISPSVFDTSGAFRDRLIGIDRALQIRERNAFETANSARVGREERIQAMNVLNALTKFRQSLGVPTQIRNDEDWRAVPAGTEYIDPEGQVRTKR